MGSQRWEKQLFFFCRTPSVDKLLKWLNSYSVRSPPNQTVIGVPTWCFSQEGRDTCPVCYFVVNWGPQLFLWWGVMCNANYTTLHYTYTPHPIVLPFPTAAPLSSHCLRPSQLCFCLSSLYCCSACSCSMCVCVLRFCWSERVSPRRPCESESVYPAEVLFYEAPSSLRCRTFVCWVPSWPDVFSSVEWPKS